ncbi:unnamed protein product, partial [Durusdinium trenchii]
VLLCPITQVMFRDPVFIPESGNTYERSAIETYWSGRPKCPRDPLTNVSLSGTLYTNWGLRREVQSFLDEHPSYVPQGWEDRSVPVPAQLPSSSNQPRRWKRLVFWLLSFCFSMAVVIEHFKSESAFYWPQLETEDTADVSYLKVPKNSRLEAYQVAGRLVIKVPAPGFQASVICPLIFSVLWLSFVSYWSITAWNSGVRMFVAFALPFWAVGVMLFLSTLLTPSLSQTLIAGPLEYQVQSQVLQLGISRFAAKVTDLEEVPGLYCMSELDCRLILQDGVQEVAWRPFSSFLCWFFTMKEDKDWRGGPVSSFSADFSSAPEWGSQRLAVLEHLEPSMKVRLEILDVAVPLSKGYPLSLNVQAKSVDAMEVACKEATAVRSSMVKRIEWRVGRISEHVNAVRAAANSMGEEEGWQPIVSPPFAAGGFENLQLHLYPLGYRVKGEDSCGFFLVCPKGMYVKCKAFVGDMVRVWDHYYEEREPYGRGNFCRLLDKVENDDSILCGIELQEIRLEQQTQVRGGPFGSVVDEVKLIAQPSTGGMEMVRELRDHSLKAKRKVHSRSAMQQYAHLAPAIDERPGAPERIPVPLPGLGGSKSSPQLPAVGLAASPKKFEPLPISPSKLSKWR